MRYLFSYWCKERSLKHNVLATLKSVYINLCMSICASNYTVLCILILYKNKIEENST